MAQLEQLNLLQTTKLPGVCVPVQKAAPLVSVLVHKSAPVVSVYWSTRPPLVSVHEPAPSCVAILKAASLCRSSCSFTLINTSTCYVRCYRCCNHGLQLERNGVTTTSPATFQTLIRACRYCYHGNAIGVLMC